MTFKDMNKNKKDSIFSMLTPLDIAGIVVGVIINLGLLILYFVMK